MTERIDQYRRGELSPQEARALAQEALDSPELFDELTDAALVNAGLNSETVRAGKVRRFPRKAVYLPAGAVAAAVLIWLVLPHRQPVLVSYDAQSKEGTVFRGDGADVRGPHIVGSILSLEEGVATVTLGSVDGVVKGSELQVFRGTEVVGRLRVNTVFRDHSRADVIEGKGLQPKDEVRLGGGSR